MEDTDRDLAKRIQDIIAVVAEDIDTITVSVEDRVAYIEGVVESEQQREVIAAAVRNIAGLRRVITCLATEHVLPTRSKERRSPNLQPTTLLRYHSLS